MSEYGLLTSENGYPFNRVTTERAAMMPEVSSTHANDGKMKRGDPSDFLTMFDEIWIRLLQLAKQLRDVMRLYNEKKQNLGWQLEVNTLKKSFDAIESSCEASRQSAFGNITGGILMCGGALLGVRLGEISSMIGNASGQMANGVAGISSAGANRRADVERSIADLQGKGSQAYARNLDDVVQKAREIMQQMIELGRSIVEVFSQTLRALTR